ncbi:alpha-1,2-fucosyltransferase [soil metagenome]
MIVVNLSGGLGNQMFQYAAGRALAEYTKTELRYHFEDNYKLARRELKLMNFNISGALLQSDEAKDHLPLRKIKRRLFGLLGRNVNGKAYFEKRYYSFDQDFFKNSEEVYLLGFWQSYKYFESIESTIRWEFTIRHKSENLILAIKKVSGDRNPVAVHIRRTDYTNPKSNFSSLDIDYYKRAAFKIESTIGSCTYVIFSDDIGWAKESLSFLSSRIYASDFGLEDFEELALMASCDHNITANSSFSWWGAWLNSNPEKVVIAPHHWHTAHTTDSELIPIDWLRL